MTRKVKTKKDRSSADGYFLGVFSIIKHNKIRSR